MKPSQRDAVEMNNDLTVTLLDLIDAVYDLPCEAATPALHEALWRAHQIIANHDALAVVRSESCSIQRAPDIQVKWEAQAAAQPCKLATSK